MFTPSFYSMPQSSRIGTQAQANESFIGDRAIELFSHQKLDYLIDANAQQSKGMDTLKTKNLQLQNELKEIKENSQSLKSQVSSTLTATASHEGSTSCFCELLSRFQNY